MIDELKRYEAARQMVRDLCNRRRDWMMSIPARPDYDPDLVIDASLNDVPKLVAERAKLRGKMAGDSAQSVYDALHELRYNAEANAADSELLAALDEAMERITNTRSGIIPF